jgi:hypothetical protein
MNNRPDGYAAFLKREMLEKRTCGTRLRRPATVVHHPLPVSRADAGAEAVRREALYAEFVAEVAAAWPTRGARRQLAPRLLQACGVPSHGCDSHRRRWWSALQRRSSAMSSRPMRRLTGLSMMYDGGQAHAREFQDPLRDFQRRLQGRTARGTGVSPRFDRSGVPSGSGRNGLRFRAFANTCANSLSVTARARFPRCWPRVADRS